MFDLKDLCRPLPPERISWRVQNLTKKKDKALALAYIDARDVYDILDEIVGPENWQNRYTQYNDRTYCSIGIKIDDEWVWKENAAGDTSIEGEKGAASDSFKRAAVCWGIGRYLYALDNTYVPCELFNNKFSKFKVDPWSCVKNSHRFMPDGVRPKQTERQPEPQRQEPEKPTPPACPEGIHPKAWNIAVNYGHYESDGYVMALTNMIETMKGDKDKQDLILDVESAFSKNLSFIEGMDSKRAMEGYQFLRSSIMDHLKGSGRG